LDPCGTPCHKLDAFTDEQQRQAKEDIQGRIWTLYAALKTYRTKPTSERKEELTKRIEEIFSTRTCYARLDAISGTMRTSRSCK
jgi:hypothetical protein